MRAFAHAAMSQPCRRLSDPIGKLSESYPLVTVTQRNLVAPVALLQQQMVYSVMHKPSA
jgi:hypothetical protein